MKSEVIISLLLVLCFSSCAKKDSGINEDSVAVSNSILYNMAHDSISVDTICSNEAKYDPKYFDESVIADDIPSSEIIQVTLREYSADSAYLYDNIHSKLIYLPGKLIIEPSDIVYYDNYTSNSNFEILEKPDFESSGSVENPNLDIIINNTTTNALIINSITFNVYKSYIDDLPYFDISTNTCSFGTIIFANESWRDFGDMILDYKILKKGEIFDGTYERTKKIKSPQDVVDIDFGQDIIAKGLNIERLVAIDGGDYYKEYGSVLGIPMKRKYNPDILFYPFEWSKDEINSSYTSFCRIYCRMSFTKSKYVFNFHGKLYIAMINGLGAACDYSDDFDLKLRTSGYNYKLVFPYVSTIPSGGVERVRIVLKCDKSSIHYFKISIDNENDLQIYSDPIKLHYLFPRHCNELMDTEVVEKDKNCDSV